MWAAENMGSKAMSQEEKRERGRKNDRGKKSSQVGGGGGWGRLGVMG